MARRTRQRRRRASAYNTTNVTGLTKLANDTGFSRQAEQINTRVGEAPNEIFSGGFVSDIFDVLNSLQYGVVGVLKGKGFKEGVKSRQSFSDKDALGDNGLPGTIAGIAMDILVDPLTYIPPLAIAKRVPGLTRAAKGIKAAIFGKKIFKPLKAIPSKKLTQLVPDIEGGTKAGRYLARKLTWVGGSDPMWKDAWERGEIGKQTAADNIKKTFKPFSEGMSGEARKNLLTRSKVVGREARLIRKPIEQVIKEAGPETGKIVKGVWDHIDGLRKQAADLGLIPKKWLDDDELWIKNMYAEFEKPKGVGGFLSKTFGVKGTTKKAKLLGKETLPARKALGEIDDPIYPLLRSAIQMSNDIEAVKMNNMIARNYALDHAEAGFKQLSKSKRFFTSDTGEKIEALSKIKNLNKELKPALKELKHTFKADKKVLAEIREVERTINKIEKTQAKGFAKLFQPEDVKGVIPTTDISLKVEDQLAALATIKSSNKTLKKSLLEFKRTQKVSKRVSAEINSVVEGIESFRKLEQREFLKLFNAGAKEIKTVSKARQLGTLPDELVGMAQNIKKFKGDFLNSKSGIELERMFEEGVLERAGFKSIDDFIDYVKNPFKEATEEVVKKTIPKGSFQKLVKLQKGVENLLSKKDVLENVDKKSLNDILTFLKNTITDIKGERAGKVSEIFGKKGLGLKEAISGDTPGKIIGKIGKQQKAISTIEMLQKQIGKLSTKTGTLKEIDKRSINDSFRFLEDTVAGITGKKEALGEVIENAKLGELSGKFVPEWMHEVIEDTIKTVGEGGKIPKKLWAGFKYGKVILNPAAHVRNPLSNAGLNWWKLGIGPWRVDKYAKAVKDFASDGPMWQRAKKVGGGSGGMMSNEIGDILLSPEGMIAGKKFGKKWREIVAAPAKLYQAEESIAKLTAFTHFVGKGVSDKKAWQMAESATFNYAQVSPFVRKLRESIWGVPFVTFGVKAAPLAVETALKHPGRISVFGKIKKGIENLADQDDLFKERANEPEWVKDGFYIRLPMKDKNGRSAYFDLTYIIPFGDLASGQFLQRATRRDTQLPESAASVALSKNPTINFIKEISRNEDFFGNKIWKESDDQAIQLKDLMRHLTKSYMPQPVADQIRGGYKADGTRVESGIKKSLEASPENQKRTLGQEILKNAGIKIQPMLAEQQENYKNWNNKKALETLLKENGVLKGYDINYIPK